ncbi:transmembrane emp24 domain-containing protein 9-like [Canis lupus familiaris]|uniref:transmembrane emp24 domain-containing protein 9-like n=1 Tax=Canis lupus familiaris TaxID=9615 RepID=UPI0018F7B03D|nr:transmembrane emp24 domain-containing protein 9-like [Canis lupus familiaris]
MEDTDYLYEVKERVKEEGNGSGTQDRWAAAPRPRSPGGGTRRPSRPCGCVRLTWCRRPQPRGPEPSGRGRAWEDVLAARGGALYFHTGEAEKKCFIEEIPDETMVIGNYRTQLYDKQREEYQPATPGLGMFVEVKDPEDKATPGLLQG